MRSDAQQLELFSTPYFLRLLIDQLAPDGRIPQGRAALFAGFARNALAREIDAHNHLLFEDELFDRRDRRQILTRMWASPHNLPERGSLIP
ncbi:MAG: hypothetical protein M1546_25425, partial [Chloroflexi bacterium]|nr:hypothetical protein [Chloroflexota bacterium]